MISIDYLRTFVEFEKTGSMALAAKSLGLTQPAVSKQLQILEESYGKPLFIPKANRKVLSPIGRILYENCGPLIEEIQRKMQMIVDPSEKRIVIAGRENILEVILKKLPSLPTNLELQFCSSSEASKKIINQEADLAISYIVPQSRQIIAKKLFNSIPNLVYSKDHYKDLKEKRIGTLSVSDLLNCPILCHRKDDPALGYLCKTKGISTTQLKFAYVTPNWQILLKAAEEGKGIAFIPSEHLEKSSLARIEFEKEGPLLFEYHLLYRKDFSKDETRKKLLSKMMS